MRTVRALKIQIAVICVFVGCSQVGANETAPKEAIAVKGAKRWLDLVDGGNYRESWNAAATYFKNAISQDQWVKSLNAVRTPLGKLAQRTLKTKEYKASLPGAPDGEYVVIQFETVFSNERSAIETITPMLDKDGKWRVAGYYIK